MDFLTNLKDAPVPTILIILGTIGLLLGIANGLNLLQIPQFEHAWQRWSISSLGAILLIIGILLYAEPSFPFAHSGNKSVPTPAATLTSTSSPVVVLNPTPTSVRVTTQNPTPISAPTATSNPTPTPTPSTTPSSSLPPYIGGSGTLVMSDPLVDNSHGYDWPTGPQSANGCAFTSSGYYITANNTFFSCLEYGIDNLSNFVFEARMAPQQGSSGGFILRNTGNNGDGYYFDVDSSGYYSIKLSSPNSTMLRQSIQSPLITKGKSSYLIDIKASGNQFTLYVDGVQIDSVTDGTYSQGRIGFYVTGGGGGPNTAVTLSNMKVWSV